MTIVSGTTANPVSPDDPHWGWGGTYIIDADGRRVAITGGNPAVANAADSAGATMVPAEPQTTSIAPTSATTTSNKRKGQ